MPKRKLERRKRPRAEWACAMGLMGPWAITKSMVKLRLHSPFGARLAHLLARSPFGGVKRPGFLSVLAGALLIAVVAMTSCTDSTVRTERGFAQANSGTRCHTNGHACPPRPLDQIGFNG